MTKPEIPKKFDGKFLNWVKQATEAAWAKNQKKCTNTGKIVDVSPWQKDTKWLSGAPELSIQKMERKWKINFLRTISYF